MRLFTYLSALLLCSSISTTTTAQTTTKVKNPTLKKESSKPVFTQIPVIFHGETEMLKNYIENPNIENPITKTMKTGYHPKSDWGVNEYDYTNALPIGNDTKLQKNYAPLQTNKALGVNIAGMPAVTSPADPSVDVGPNHVIQMINGNSGSTFKIWDKTGAVVQGATIFDNFMNTASANGNPGWSGAGDPIVVYDARADRWLLSEFQSGGNSLFVAISTTADPTGSYYTYTITQPAFPDYPKYSVWDNEYIVTSNTSSSDIIALNRTAMLAGTPSTAQKFTQSNFGTIGFQASTPVNLDGTAIPPAGTPAMVMRMTDDAWTGATQDALEIWEMDIDWITPANSTFSLTSTLGVSPFDSGLCGYTAFQCIPQPGTGTTLDPLREVLMNRIHYRNFGSHESIVCCHSVDINGSDWAGVRWYELRRTGGTGGSWAVYQEGTYAPDSDHRWMGSIGISASGNIGLAYNVSSSSTFPSLRYTGRKDCDPLNTMTEPETIIVAGTASNGGNRYGDYNALGTDPTDGETFWFTGMYNTSSNASTRVAAFNISGCAPVVQFGGSTYEVNEPDANVTNGCLDYFVLNIPIQIALDPSQIADVTVNVTGGTAVQGEDFDIFNTVFSFDGVNLSGVVEIRIYNDNYVEGTETITLDYSLNANGGDASPGVINQTVTVNINDDDLIPSAMTNTTILLTEDFEAGFGSFTTNNTSGATAWQVGNAAAASTGAYTVPASNATQIAWINDDMCNCDQNNVDLTFPSIDLTGFSSASLTFDAYYGNLTYQGNTEIAEVSVSVNGGAFALIAPLTASGSWSQQTFDLTPYVGNNNVVLNINYSDGTGWLYGCAIDNINIQGQGPIDIQTVINTGSQTDAYLGPNSTVHFYDQATQNVMMSITNTSGFDYGCVAVEVDRDGSTPTALQFASSNAADFIHSKSFKVTPTNNNPTGTFDITLFYKEAEVAAWELATGNSRNNLEIIKVAGNNPISAVTPANYSTFTINNVIATMGSFNTDLTFTASFTNGFSGFGLGVYAIDVPAVPVANFNPSTTSTCEGATVNYTDLSTGVPTSWAWDFGDGNTSTLQNPSNTFTTAGTYTTTLVATNSFGTNTFTTSIFVGAPTTSSQNLSVCAGSSITVGTNTYTSAGTYTDVLINSAGCDSTVTTNLTVDPLPTVTIGALPTAVCIDAALIPLTATPAGGSFSGTGVTGSDFDPTTGAGVYAITYSYTDGLGCSNQDVANITINPLPTVTIGALPSTVCVYNSPITLSATPTGGVFSGTGVTGNSFDPATGVATYTITYDYTDGNNCSNQDLATIIVDNCSDINEAILTGVALYPNPNNGNFIIKGLEIGAIYEIFDATGKLILKETVSSFNEEVKLPAVESGNYFMTTVNKKGKKGSIQFFVENK